MANRRLAGVVRGLQLGDIDNVTAHRRRRDEATAAVVFQLVAALLLLLFLLAAPVTCRYAGAEEDTVDIRLHHVIVVIQRTVHHGAFAPGNAGVGDDNVQTSVEVGDDLVERRLDLRIVLDFEIVCLACKKRGKKRC